MCPREQVFQEYGLPEAQRMVVFIYGGQPPGEWCLREESLPAGWTCIVCAAGSPPGGRALPQNFILAPADAYTPDLVSLCLRSSFRRTTIFTKHASCHQRRSI